MANLSSRLEAQLHRRVWRRLLVFVLMLLCLSAGSTLAVFALIEKIGLLTPSELLGGLGL